MKSEIERRAALLAEYIIENKATVRAAAARFGVSKSTVHTDRTIWNGSSGGSNSWQAQHIVANERGQELWLLPSAFILYLLPIYRHLIQ